MTALATRPIWQGRWIEHRTGPLDRLRARKAFGIFDLENLIYGARDIGCRLDLATLTGLLRSSTRACVLHAVFSAPPGEVPPHLTELEELGWRVHVNPIETVRTHRGLEHKANSDNLLLFKAGSLLSRSSADCVVLGSGDGDLVQTLAHCIQQHLDKPRDTFTLSLPGSTSHRLNAVHNSLIAANLEIGRDCLTPLSCEGGFRHASLHTW